MLEELRRLKHWHFIEHQKAEAAANDRRASRHTKEEHSGNAVFHRTACNTLLAVIRQLEETK